MNSPGWTIELSAALFAGMMLCLDLGYRLGRRHAREQAESAHQGIGAIEAAVFALLGLLLGFSFAGGTSRLDTRRDLIVREANAIGTAYLRIDLLTVEQQPEMRRLFRQYLDSRLSVYEKLATPGAAEQELAHAGQIQQQIWLLAVKDSSADSTHNVARLLLPAINEMIDITASRTIALHTHLPNLILVLLISVALLSGLLAGYAMAERKKRSLIHMSLYAVVVAITIYSVLDLDNPRSGLIRLTAADSAMQQLRDSIR